MVSADSTTPAISQEVALPISFRSLAIAQAGGPVTMEQKSITTMQDDEVLIRVEYASINKMDPGLARANAYNFPFPYVLGFDFSGEVVKVGAQCQEAFKVGDEVLGWSPTGTCYAEYVVAQRKNIVRRGAVPAPEASTYGIAYLTAYESLVITGEIEQHRGKWIYVAGAAGGVGHFAAQIAKLYGLKVIGSAGKVPSIELLRKLQLESVIDYSKKDVVQEVMTLTGGKGVDLVYESTFAQSSYAQSAAVIASGGEYIRLGTEAQVARAGVEDVQSVVEGRGAEMVIADLGRYASDPLYQAQTAKLTDGLKQAVSWYENGQLRPVITATILFDATALQEAFDAFLNGTNNVGKVVVRCASPG
jgi:NADPH:quinone reductase-like Zn-dependent oxidoreductase